MIVEGILSAIFLALLSLLLNPFEFWMPTQAHMMIIVLLVAVFAVFSAFVFKEQARDEREVLHRYIANRFAYLSGIGILVFAVIVQSFHHTVDVWVVSALGIMILAKIVGVIYSRIKH